MKKEIFSISLLTLSLFFLSCSTTPKKPDYSEFNTSYSEFLESAVKELGTKHGLSLAVVKDDQVIFEHYHGLANIDKGIKVDENTLFYIASATKSFTALSALILENKGKLDLDKSLSAYFPEVNFAPELKADHITGHDLLLHTSGIKNWPIINSTAYTGIHDQNQLLEQLSQLTKVNQKAPHGKFQYSNLGYNILSMIMERELDTDWQSVLEEEIFNPLQMNRTTALMSTADQNGWEVAKPHSQLNDQNKLERLLLEKKDNTMHAAGGMITTSRDMARWLIMELNNGKIDNKQIFDTDLIKKSVLSHVRQDRKYMELKRFGYGYGWNQGTTNHGDTLVHHFVGYVGFHSEVSFMQSKKVGVVVMANESDTGRYLSFLLTSYAIDYFSGRKDIDVYYQNKLKEYSKTIATFKENVKEHYIKLAERQWQLELPFSSYAGKYTSDLFGTLIIEHLGENRLIASSGNLKSVDATPYKNANSIRVEMVPGSGSGIQFIVNEGKVEQAIWEDQIYTRVIN
ncbi:serine hydrolase domain-containing protein [Aquimarina algiphila]|uniref:serine hydrolase domain-containing protein n=1 Tax=Aquimarina algiphila TaxID=2047982 RepID=UPI00232FC4E4|nr:serine hydrolase domain-containing protein [Aquimarina algiphila]